MPTNHGLYTDTAWAVPVLFKDAAGAAVDMSGYAYVAQLIAKGAVAFTFRSTGNGAAEGTIDTAQAAAGTLTFRASSTEHAAVAAGLYRIHLKRDVADDTWAAEGSALIGAPGANETYIRFDTPGVLTAEGFLGAPGTNGTTPTPGGADKAIQYNDGNAWGGEAAFAYDKSTNTLSLAGQAAIPLQTLDDGATIDWNTAAGAKAKVVLGGARQFNAVSNAIEGASYLLWAIQDATGGRVPTFVTTGAGSFDFGADGVPTLSTAANKADALGFEAISIGGTLKLRFVGIKKGFA